MASSSDGTNEEPTSTAGVMRSIAKIEGGSTYLKESMSTFSSASIDGKAQKGDVRHSDADMPGALAVLKSMVGKAKEAAPEGKKKEKWAFRASPHAAMGKTLDDTFIAFLMWGRTSAADEDDDDATPTEINISKAFRRLEVYAEWMEENAADLITSPLTFESVKEVNEAWTMSASYDDKGRLVWWVDLGKLNVPAIKKIPIEDSFRGCAVVGHRMQTRLPPAHRTRSPHPLTNPHLRPNALRLNLVPRLARCFAVWSGLLTPSCTTRKLSSTGWSCARRSGG